MKKAKRRLPSKRLAGVPDASGTKGNGEREQQIPRRPECGLCRDDNIRADAFAASDAAGALHDQADAAIDGADGNFAAAGA